MGVIRQAALVPTFCTEGADLVRLEGFLEEDDHAELPGEGDRGAVVLVLAAQGEAADRGALLGGPHPHGVEGQHPGQQPRHGQAMSGRGLGLG